MDLTDRQKDLLRAIIELYVKTGEPVGSENVEKEYNLGVSPATIRNEMVRLTDLGYLKQPHTSAGRIPTTMGFRLYIAELMREKSLSIAAEVSIKENLWQQRHQENRLLREAVKALALRTGVLSLAINYDGEVVYAGAANILDFPEFSDIDVTRYVLGMFDEFPTLKHILGKAQGKEPIHILFGDELQIQYLETTSFVFCKYEGRNERDGIVGVIGPARLNFPFVMPIVKYTANVIEEALKSW